jgi:hypothetical protein
MESKKLKREFVSLSVRKSALGDLKAISDAGLRHLCE